VEAMTIMHAPAPNPKPDTKEKGLRHPQAGRRRSSHPGDVLDSLDVWVSHAT
jgi:hypothetical protein